MNSSSPQFVKNLTGSVPDDLSPIKSLSEIDDGSEGSFFSNYWILIIVGIFVLAFLGLNVFTYLSQGTEKIEEATHPIIAKFLAFFGGSVLDTTKQTVNVSATGTKGATDITANTITSGIDYIENQAQNGNNNQAQRNNNQNQNNAYDEEENNQQMPPRRQAIQQKKQSNQLQGINAGKRVGQQISSVDMNETENYLENDSLNKALQNAAQNSQTGAPYQADDAYSSVQSGGSKAGWCLVGQDKLARSCVEVGENDTCMSGNIFPSHEICVNPNLRA
jgi:hypothetical protein